MPILGAVLLLIQGCFAYHALKTGRPYWWLFVIMGFPVMGCVLYYFIEVFPTSRESRKAEKAVRAIARSFDPDKSLREHVADLEDCGSVENRIALARSCMDRRLYPEAISLYKSCLNGVHASDPDIRFNLASAQLGAGQFRDAYDTAQALRQSHPAFRTPEVQLIAGKALEGGGQFDQALEEYRVLADTYAGEEGRWRYGALLLRMGRTGDAAEVFRRMLRNADRMPPHYREAQQEWLTLARGHVQA
ncbi:MAG TPA: tetratricopeptide repeat protein [Burkholderiales bacterium]|nr:tetratricopeptide repeat protein [Burkholderiales bacterium]